MTQGYDLGPSLLKVKLLHELCHTVGVRLTPAFLRKLEHDSTAVFRLQRPLRAADILSLEPSVRSVIDKHAIAKLQQNIINPNSPNNPNNPNTPNETNHLDISDPTSLTNNEGLDSDPSLPPVVLKTEKEGSDFEKYMRDNFDEIDEKDYENIAKQAVKVNYDIRRVVKSLGVQKNERRAFNYRIKAHREVSIYTYIYIYKYTY